MSNKISLEFINIERFSKKKEKADGDIERLSKMEEEEDGDDDKYLIYYDNVLSAFINPFNLHSNLVGTVIFRL